MPYKIDPIRLSLEISKATISTTLHQYEVVPEVVADPLADPPIIGVPAYDLIKNSRSVSSSCKVDPFSNPSLVAARTILVNNIMEQIKLFKRLMDREIAIAAGDTLSTIKTNIETRIALL